MKDEDDFRIIEEHDAQTQQPSPSSPEQKTTPPVETEEPGISFDADKAAKQKSPIPGNTQNKTPLTSFDQPVKQSPQKQPPAGEANTANKKPQNLGNTPAGQPQQSSKTPPSDNTPPSSSKRFSKAIFPKDEEEHISPEGVVLRDHDDDEKERTPSFEQTREDFSHSNILLEEKPVTPVRDPLFAAHVLSEQGRDKEQKQPQSTTPERPIPVPGARRKKEERTKPQSGPQQSSIVRTYESDIAQALKKGQASLTKMVMAEEEKKKEKTQQQSKEQVRTIGFLGGTVLLLVAAGAVIGGALFYQNITQSPPPQPSEATPGLFLVENTVTLDAEENLLSSIQNTFANLTGDLDSITRLRITENRAVGEEGAIQQVPLTAEEFLVASAVGAPESLRRSLLDEFVLGAYLFDGTQPFLVLKTDSFENAFSGMLEWEEDGLSEDIAALFGLNLQQPPDASFSDYVLKNRDLRALRSQDGSLLLFYTFINSSTLVITTRESTLDEVARRIYRNQ